MSVYVNKVVLEHDDTKAEFSFLEEKNTSQILCFQVRWGDKTASATGTSHILIVPEADGAQGDSQFSSSWNSGKLPPASKSFKGSYK